MELSRLRASVMEHISSDVVELVDGLEPPTC